MSSVVGHVRLLRRYPVKSMLGEEPADLRLEPGGVVGDRVLALVDRESGRVATAKHPRLWRMLLRCAASGDPGRVVVRLPDGSTVGAAEADAALSDLLGRPVRLTAERPDGAAVERPAPEDVLAEGDDADVPFELLEIAQGSPGSTFVDHSPVHLITTATVVHIGTEVARYRPNLVLDVPGAAAFAENSWVGREITVGDGVVLRGTLPTPRCAVPTLEHGTLPRAPHAVRTPLDENRVEVPGFGVLPCAGLYAEVVAGGTVALGGAVGM